MTKPHFQVRTSFCEFFSIVALADVNEGGSPYMGISPEEHARIDQSERKSRHRIREF